MSHSDLNKNLDLAILMHKGHDESLLGDQVKKEKAVSPDNFEATVMRALETKSNSEGCRVDDVDLESTSDNCVIVVVKNKKKGDSSISPDHTKVSRALGPSARGALFELPQAEDVLLGLGTVFGGLLSESYPERLEYDTDVSHEPRVNTCFAIEQ